MLPSKLLCHVALPYLVDVAMQAKPLTDTHPEGDEIQSYEVHT